MAFLFARTKKDNGNVTMWGSTLKLMTLLIAISKAVAEKLAAEKKISLEAAEYVVIDAIKDGMKTIKKQKRGKQ